MRIEQALRIQGSKDARVRAFLLRRDPAQRRIADQQFRDSIPISRPTER
jgi:hypothetical protein